MLKGKFFTSKKVAISWVIIMSCLFFIPGSALPERKVDIPLDKLIHISFFALLVFLWRSAFPGNSRYYNTAIFTVAVVYGFLVEVMQGWLVAQRSFDIYDLFADAFGAVAGLIVWAMVYKKK